MTTYATDIDTWGSEEQSPAYPLKTEVLAVFCRTICPLSCRHVGKASGDIGRCAYTREALERRNALRAQNGGTNGGTQSMLPPI